MTLKEFFNDVKKAREEARRHHPDHPYHHGVHHPAGKFLRHAIFGVNDGLVSTLGLVAGLTGALFTNNIVIMAGIVEMFVGAISMALGTYISTKSQLEFYHMEYNLIKQDLDKRPQEEINHLKDIYKKRGFVGSELHRIVTTLSTHKKAFLDVITEEDLGFGKEELDNPFTAGITMFFFFTIGCIVPLAPYFFFSTFTALKLSSIASILLLFFVGTGKTYFTGKNWFRNGLEMIIIGAVATIVAYYIGKLLEPLLRILF